MAEEFIIKGNCPDTEIVTELAGYSEFASPNSSSEENLITRAHLTEITATCESNERSITVDMALEFKGMAGPKSFVKSADKSSHAYPFFVAITSPGGKILAKEVFSAAMDFNSSAGVKTYNETLRQIIPLSNQEDGKRHKILVGFQLNQQQLEYNRNILAQQQILDDAAALAKQQGNNISSQVKPAAPLNANDPIVIERISTP